MLRLEDYRHLEPFSADELIECANALLRPLPQVQVQKRTLRFYSSKGLLPPPEGPRSKAVYRYEHLVVLVALRVFKQAGVKLERIKEIINTYAADDLQKLAQIVQNHLDKLQQTNRPDLLAETLWADVSAKEEEIMDDIVFSKINVLGSALFMQPSPKPPLPSSIGAQHVIRLPLGGGITLEFKKEKPIPEALKEALLKILLLLKRHQ